MAYTPTTWADEVPNSSPVRYRITRQDNTVLVDNAIIEVITPVTAGTPVNASNLNHLEQGLKQASDEIAAGIPAKFTATGDTVHASGVGVAEILTIGTSKAIYAVNNGKPAWVMLENLFSFLTGVGDLLYASAAGVAARLAKGNTGDGLVQGSSIPEWKARKWAVNFPLGNGADVIETGLKYAVDIPSDCYIDAVRLLSLDGTSGSIVVNVWKATYANLPATSANKITASAPPTISSGTKSQDTTLTGWTRSISAGDWLYINVDSVTSLKNVILSISGHQL